MSKLLINAKTRYQRASRDMKDIANPDMNLLEAIAFDMQQGIEFALKYLCEMVQYSYPRTHDLGRLLVLATPMLESFSDFTRLEGLAKTISNWEAMCRYCDDAIINPDTVHEAYGILGRLISYIEGTYGIREERNYTQEQIEWCRANAPAAMKDCTDDELWSCLQKAYFEYTE